jgi:hypothetical protein
MISNEGRTMDFSVILSKGVSDAGVMGKSLAAKMESIPSME